MLDLLFFLFLDWLWRSGVVFIGMLIHLVQVHVVSEVDGLLPQVLGQGLEYVLGTLHEHIIPHVRRK